MMETGTPDANKSENSFEWDEKSQLYFHARLDSKNPPLYISVTLTSISLLMLKPKL